MFRPHRMHGVDATHCCGCLDIPRSVCANVCLRVCLLVTPVQNRSRSRLEQIRVDPWNHVLGGGYVGAIWRMRLINLYATAMRPSVRSLRALVFITDSASGGSIGGWGRPPRERARKIFLNVSENKSSNRKLSLIPFESSASCYDQYPFRRL